MKHLMIVLLVFLTASLCCAQTPKADFYVSVNGSDSWSGTLAEPNAQGDDGPFATLPRARDAVRVFAQSERFVPRGKANELRFPIGRLKNWPNVTDVDIVVRPTRKWSIC